MKKDIHVKAVTTKAGKSKYQASIWHKGVFYGSKTFDNASAAREYKERALIEVLRGSLLPAKERREQRIADASLKTTMDKWAEVYIKDEETDHCANRIGDYRKVGRLLSHLPLSYFSGLEGAKRLYAIMKQWKKCGRLPRSNADKAAADFQGSPLSDQEVRLRTFAVLRIIQHAETQLPPGCSFETPILKKVSRHFKMPPAYSSKRTRMPTDAEYVQLISHFGFGNELGQLVFLLDETGCRLGEISRACAENLQVYKAGNDVTGGHLHLTSHKTAKSTGEARYIPLSQQAANLLHQRQLLVGRGKLFPNLGSTDAVCKAFAAGMAACGIEGLMLKDFRRAFINRNKYAASSLDLHTLFGNSTLLKEAGISEQVLQKGTGHKDLATTAIYTIVDLPQMSAIFTGTSRAKLVLNVPLTLAAKDEDIARRIAEMKAEMQARVATLEAMSQQKEAA